MSPTIVAIMVAAAFFLGYISRWLQDTDTAAPLDEGYVSNDCLKWVERQERSK